MTIYHYAWAGRPERGPHGCFATGKESLEETLLHLSRKGADAAGDEWWPVGFLPFPIQSPDLYQVFRPVFRGGELFAVILKLERA